MNSIISNFKCEWIMSKKDFYQIVSEDGLLSILFFIAYFICLIFGFISLLIKLLIYPLVFINNKIKIRFQAKYIAMNGEA